MEYIIQNQKINIDLNKDVFSPSIHGSKALGESIKINKGESVLDIGTGTGLLAILSAKLGGIVTATDILPEAIKLTKNNAEKNNISVDVGMSDLFDSVEGVYDVIIANVPQEILSPKIILASEKNIVTGIHGGEKGNKILLKVLEDSPKHMSKNSRLYVVVYSLNDFRESILKILEIYDTKLINFYNSPVKDFIYEDADWYKEQLDCGMVGMYKKDNKYYADLFVFELKLKS